MSALCTEPCGDLWACAVYVLIHPSMPLALDGWCVAGAAITSAVLVECKRGGDQQHKESVSIACVSFRVGHVNKVGDSVCLSLLVVQVRGMTPGMWPGIGCSMSSPHPPNGRLAGQWSGKEISNNDQMFSRNSPLQSIISSSEGHNGRN